MSVGMLEIDFLNFSKTVSFSACLWGSVFGLTSQYYNSTPGDTLASNGGAESIACSDSAPVITANMDIFCCWMNPTSLQRFGVWIHDPGQFLGFGTGPYYYVMSDVVASAACIDNGVTGVPTDFANWTQVEDPALQYDWTDFQNLTINATPTVGDNRLVITVTISDALS